MNSLRLIRGHGVTDRVAAEEACAELDVHHDEAIAFLDDCAPLISALGRVVLELGPREYHLIRMLRRRHDLYRLRHQPIEEPAEVAA